MDASKSLKIARKRFQNGNYLLSQKKYQAARKEFEVALTIFEKADTHKETAEALNNIGITLVKEHRPDEAKGYFERSYELKKAYDNSGESLFNTLYNLIGVGSALTEEEFEAYYHEMKAVGDMLGGEHSDTAEKEKVLYDRFAEAREKERQRQEEERLARTTPAGALARLAKEGMPCVLNIRFVLNGFSIGVPGFTYESEGERVKLLGISAAEGPGPASMGEIEFTEPYNSVKEFLDMAGGDREPVLMEVAFGHVKKFMDALAMVREDIGFCIGKRDCSILSITLKNAFGEPVEMYRQDAGRPPAAVTLTGEDTMMVNAMLSTRHSPYKMLLLGAKRSLAEENYAPCIVDAVEGFETFMDLLLKKALPEDERRDYISTENPCLRERVRFLKRLVGGADTPDSLERYLGDIGRDMDDALAYYDVIMGNDGHTIGAYEAGKTLDAVSRAIYHLKARYDA